MTTFVFSYDIQDEIDSVMFQVSFVSMIEDIVMCQEQKVRLQFQLQTSLPELKQSVESMVEEKFGKHAATNGVQPMFQVKANNVGKKENEGNNENNTQVQNIIKFNLKPNCIFTLHTLSSLVKCGSQDEADKHLETITRKLTPTDVEPLKTKLKDMNDTCTIGSPCIFLFEIADDQKQHVPAVMHQCVCMLFNTYDRVEQMNTQIMKDVQEQLQPKDKAQPTEEESTSCQSASIEEVNE